MSEKPDWAKGREWAGWVWVDYYVRFDDAAPGECAPDYGFMERLSKRDLFGENLDNVMDREVNIIREACGKFVLSLGCEEIGIRFECAHTARKIADLIVSDAAIGGWA